MSKEIPLTQGKVVVVDDEDFDWLNQWKWCALKRRHTWYAVRHNPTRNGKRTMIQMHRQIVKPPMGMDTDHKDGNGLDNRRCNLRAATHAQNRYNQRKQKGTTSQYKGGTWNRHAAKWEAKIMVDRKSIYLGYFLSEREAARAYDAAAIKYFREFAHTNFPREKYL